uniref:Resistance to inhibitors of cholinesterase protein 3 N-terminal domain-containing protein n=1 Tax=Parascaris univalens TaxID=6257 RepID=A0A914ZUT8_PARUN
MPNSETTTRSRRRRRRSSNDDDGPVSGWKMGLVVGVVVLCFGMLYPSLFHPMISSLFSKPPPPQQTIPNRPPIHPSMSSPRARPDIHPGMRMAAAQAEATATSSSKGMFAWMLPLYTVGVVVFLIYTLVKSKRKKQHRRHAYSSDESESYDEDDEYEQSGRGVRNLGRRKLRSLQERLKQTELAMSKILEQLSTISVEPTQGALPQDLENTVDQKSKTNGESKKTDADKEHYLRDLEKALREFKHLSNSYNKKERKRRGESLSEEEEMNEYEFEEEMDEDEGIEEKSHDGGGSEGSAAEDEAENGSGDEREGKQEDGGKKGEDEALGPTVEQHVQQTRPHKRSKRT